MVLAGIEMVISVKLAFKNTESTCHFLQSEFLSQWLMGQWKSETNDWIFPSYVQKRDNFFEVRTSVKRTWRTSTN